MESSERRQLHDEIVAGAVKVEDVPMGKLKDFRADFDMDYQPSMRFFTMIGEEILRRESVPKKRTAIKHDFC